MRNYEFRVNVGLFNFQDPEGMRGNLGKRITGANTTCDIFTYLTESQTLKRRKSIEKKDINTVY